MVGARELADWIWDQWEGKKSPNNARLWTRRMNGRLAEEARRLGWVRYYSGPKRKKSEYLVDHCWAKPWRGMRTYRGLELAAEFEFGGTPAKIEDDLVKLADVRARARLFVGNLWKWSPAKAQQLADATAAMLSRHRFARGDWIVLALGPKGKRATTRDDIRIWKVTRRGPKLLWPRPRR